MLDRSGTVPAPGPPGLSRVAVPEYTLLTVIAVIAVVVLELAWLRTGIFRTAQYWCSW